MKQILHNNITTLAILSLLSLVGFFFSAALESIEAVISHIKQSLEQGSSFTYHLSHY